MKEPSGNARAILIVDDEEIITDSLKALLSKLGDIECAKNGEEALEKLAGKSYAAIISDMNMPVMNGMDFYKQAVKEHPVVKDRFLFYTGFADTRCRAFLERHNLRHLTKPSSIKEIKNMITRILDGR